MAYATKSTCFDQEPRLDVVFYEIQDFHQWWCNTYYVDFVAKPIPIVEYVLRLLDFMFCRYVQKIGNVSLYVH